MIIALDTETTGVPLWSYPDPYNKAQTHAWPRLVSVAWQVVTKAGDTSPEEWVARPDGFRIPKKASDIHGITQNKALAVGRPISKILDVLHALISSDTTGVVVLAAYNHKFDYG